MNESKIFGMVLSKIEKTTPKTGHYSRVRNDVIVSVCSSVRSG